MRIRRNQIIFFVVFFLGFFAFSNYLLGFLGLFHDAGKGGSGNKSSLDLAVEQENLKSLKLKIDALTRENGDLKDRIAAARKNVDIKTVDTTTPPNVPDKSKKTAPEQLPDESKITCKHKRSRDYEKEPIVVSGAFNGRFNPCDIPCEGGGKEPDASMGSGRDSCTHTKSIFFTMENQSPAAGQYDIVANTALSSDVPLPYFNWVEYKFKRPAAKKTATAQVAAFISNCGPQKRLKWMRDMEAAGVKIDSYGSCQRNKDMPADILSKYGQDYNGAKMHVVSTYKFTMSFENSETDDYVTEKLFGVLVAGSVPLYHGAPNGKKFGPSAKSMLFANDFGTAEKMAEHILYLDKNDTAYEEYLAWKKTGPTDDFTALMDIGNVHSSCRLCIRTADLHRREVGETIPGKPQGEEEPSGAATKLKVRERGKFWLRDIYLVDQTLKELKSKLNTYVPHSKDAYIYNIYEYWTRKDITTDADVRALEDNAELEVVYVTPEVWS